MKKIVALCCFAIAALSLVLPYVATPPEWGLRAKIALTSGGLAIFFLATVGGFAIPRLMEKEMNKKEKEE